MIGPRIPRSLLEHADDETWDVVDPDSQYFLKTRTSFKPVSELDICQIGDDRDRHGRCQRRVHARMCSPPTVARCTRAEQTNLLIRELPCRAHKRLGMKTLTILSVLAFCNFRTCMSHRCPLKCGVPTLCTTSSKCPRMRARSGSTLTEEFWGGHLDGVAVHSRFPSRTASLACAHHDAGFCYRGTCDTPPTPPWRVGIRPRVPARSICLSRRRLHCSRVSGSMQAMSSEWSSVRRASPCHRTRSFAGDELEGRTLGEAPRHRCLTRWCWRVRRVHHAASCSDWLLVLVDSRVVFVSKGERINFLLRKRAACDIALEGQLGESSGMPLHDGTTCNNGMHRRAAVCSAALAEMKSVNRCQPRRMQPVNMCEHSTHPGCKSHINDSSQFCVGGFFFSLMSSDCLLTKVNTVDDMKKRKKHGASDCSYTSCWSCAEPIFITPSWFSAPWARHCLSGSHASWRTRNIVQVTSKDLLDRNARFLREDETSWCRTLCPRTAQRYDGTVAEFENICESETSTGSKSSSITVCHRSGSSLHPISSHLLCVRNPRTGTSRHSHFWPEALNVLLARSCGADLEDHQTVFRHVVAGAS